MEIRDFDPRGKSRSVGEACVDETTIAWVQRAEEGWDNMLIEGGCGEKVARDVGLIFALVERGLA